MLAVVETVILTTLVVVEADQVSLNCIIKVPLLYENVRAKDYLVTFWDECPLHEAVTIFEPNVDSRLKDEVARQQTIRDCLKELICTYVVAMISKV